MTSMMKIIMFMFACVFVICIQLVDVSDQKPFEEPNHNLYWDMAERFCGEPLAKELKKICKGDGFSGKLHVRGTYGRLNSSRKLDLLVRCCVGRCTRRDILSHYCGAN